MSKELKVCVFDVPGVEGDEAVSSAFTTLKGVRVVGAVNAWEDLREWLKLGDIDLVVINLDQPEYDGVGCVEHIVESNPNVAILGVSRHSDPQGIIAAMRAGCSQFVSWPIDPDDLRSALERIRATRVSTVVPESKRICVIGSSGGAGATTIACNLAMELANISDRKAALIDLNLEYGDVSCAFDCQPKYTVADVCREGTEVDRTLMERALEELSSGLFVLSRPNQIDEAREVTPENVQIMLQVLSQMFPYVVVDLPRMSSFFSAAAVQDAAKLLIVTQLTVPSIRNATRIYEALQQLGADPSTIEIVLNRVKANFERISENEVETHFNRPVFGAIPNDYRQVATAMDLGQAIADDAPASSARLAIQELARKIAETTGEKTEKPKQESSKGLLGRLWKRSAKAGV